MQETLQKIKDCELSFPNGTDPLIKDLLSRVLDRNPSGRFSIQEVLEHEFFRKRASWVEKGSLSTRNQESRKEIFLGMGLLSCRGNEAGFFGSKKGLFGKENEGNFNTNKGFIHNNKPSINTDKGSKSLLNSDKESFVSKIRPFDKKKGSFDTYKDSFNNANKESQNKENPYNKERKRNNTVHISSNLNSGYVKSLKNYLPS